MKTIALRFSDVQLTDKFFLMGSANQSLFNPVGFYHPTDNVASAEGTLLNGRVYSHRLYARKTLSITISADEIPDVTTLNYLQDFFTANYKYIAHTSTGGSFGDYIEVLTDSGDFPISYIDELIDLPEVQFKLRYVEATR